MKIAEIVKLISSAAPMLFAYGFAQAASISLVRNPILEMERPEVQQQYLWSAPGGDSETCGVEDALGRIPLAIQIKGRIERGDVTRLEGAISESALTEKVVGCRIPILLDSIGGDIDEAMEIGRTISSTPRLVIVPDGGSCLSACVLILMSAHTNTGGPKGSLAFAFSNATIGVHAPYIDLEAPVGKRELERVLANPSAVFASVGRYWNSITSYMLSVSHSTHLLSQMSASASLPAGQFLLIQSPIERQIAGIQTIFSPEREDGISVDEATLRGICLLSLLTDESASALKLNETSLLFKDIYYMYDPGSNRVCYLKVREGQAPGAMLRRGTEVPRPRPKEAGVTRMIATVGLRRSEDYRYLAEPPLVFEPPGTNDTARGDEDVHGPLIVSEFQRILDGLGLTQKQLLSYNGAGGVPWAAADSYPTEDMASVWDFYDSLIDRTKLEPTAYHEDRPNFTSLFSNYARGCAGPDDNPSDDDVRFRTLLEGLGLMCNQQLANYAFGALMFRLNDLDSSQNLNGTLVLGESDGFNFDEVDRGGGFITFDNLTTIPASIRNPRMRLSPDCGNRAQLCSDDAAYVEGGRLVVFSRGETRGVSTSSAPKLETANFPQGSPKSLDFVVVVDDSSAMERDLHQFFGDLSSKLDTILSISPDVRLCILTTDLSYYLGSPVHWGKRPNSGELEAGDAFLTKDSTGKARKFAQTVEAIGSGFSSDERAIAQLYYMVRDHGAAGCLRRSGTLVVTVISDEDERSVGGDVSLSAEQYHDLEVEDKPEEIADLMRDNFPGKRFLWNAIVVRPGDRACERLQDEDVAPSFPGVLYSELAERTGGLVGRICDENYDGQLDAIIAVSASAVRAQVE